MFKLAGCNEYSDVPRTVCQTVKSKGLGCQLGALLEP